MQTSPNIAGTWYNQHGSTLHLELGSEGRLSGTFRSHTGLAKPSDACVLSGYVAGELVAFVVNFGGFHSLTTWAGHLSQEGLPIIRACWHMTVKLPTDDAAREAWRGVWTGEDEFRREPFGARPTPARLRSDPFLDWP